MLFGGGQSSHQIFFSKNVYSHKNVQNYMKDAEFAESKEKSNFRFLFMGYGHGHF